MFKRHSPESLMHFVFVTDLGSNQERYFTTRWTERVTKAATDAVGSIKWNFPAAGQPDVSSVPTIHAHFLRNSLVFDFGKITFEFVIILKVYSVFVVGN